MVVIQNIINDASVDEEKLKFTCQQFMQEFNVGDSELVVRLVSPVEIQVLNKEYRSKNQVTNVLSFSSDIPLEIGESILGDVVICMDVVREEAVIGGKAFSDHLNHMAIHGILHLLGYDHDDLPSANKMEGIEIEFLKKIGILERANILSEKMTFKEKANMFYRLKRLLDYREMGGLFKVLFAQKKGRKFSLGF